ncbi:MAG: ABC transporter permease [Paracoccaceae bacterium]
MLLFILKRLMGMVLTMVVVSIMVYLIMELPPGDYAERWAFRKFGTGGQTITEADMEAIRARLGLDAPFWERYFDWITGIVFHGDFGQAYAFDTSVNNILGDKFWLSLALLITTLILTYALSIPIGMYAAVRRYSAADYGLTVFSYLGLALPNFLLALILMYFGAIWFGADIGGLFSSDYEGAPWSVAKALDLLAHLVIPAVVLAWSATAFQVQTVRATMLDELDKLSVTAARARGVPEGRLLVKYPARLALNPVVSSIGFDINRIFSELPVVALVLTLPEMGQLLLKSFQDLDTNTAGAILLILTFIIVFMNFVSDVLLALLDPRIKMAGG